MTNVYDVPADKLIEIVTEKLKENDSISPPEWSRFVKTGVHKEKPPIQKDWWYTRTAAILRTVYIKGPIGVSRLRAKYGGKKNRGSQPNRARKGSGKIIRTCLQQLEESKLIALKGGRGRVVTAEGQRFLDNASHEVLRGLVKEDALLGKY